MRAVPRIPSRGRLSRMAIASLTLHRLGGIEHTLRDPARALFFRGSLPGAFGYDHAAHVLRMQIEQGAHPLDLLPLALPASWMVNSKASSQVFQRYFMPDAMAAWETVIETLTGATAWSGLADATHNACTAAVSVLANVPGSSLSSVSKVLALLLSAHAPIMADSEVWFVTGAAEGGLTKPLKADGETATSVHFAPMMSWYDQEQTRLAIELAALAAAHPLAQLTARQVLDRLVWYAAWGEAIDRAVTP